MNGNNVYTICMRGGVFFYLPAFTQIHCPYPEKNFCFGKICCGGKINVEEMM
jgi:hypothetical protein